ncbi:MAG: hypothetical protein ACIAS6_10950 [Phycisphaerales bacterium JB060]
MTRPHANLLRNQFRTGLAAAVLAGSLTLAVPQQASAQAASQTQGEALRPPRPTQPAKPPVITNFLIAGVVVIGIVAATVIPAKRGHQD